MIGHDKAALIGKARIRTLEPVLVNKIAAGEVIEGPHSVVKELTENALDAGARTVSINTYGGGMDRIVIEDDGCGIHFDDLPLSICRHATSKISQLQDMDRLCTLGFRGEALAAIGSAARLTIRSRRTGAEYGGKIECRGGNILGHEIDDIDRGSIIVIEDLFYATPARRKFVKSPRSENASIAREVMRQALANPAIAFSYRRDEKEYFNLPAVSDLEKRINDIYRSRLRNGLINIDAKAEGFRIYGCLSDENHYRSNREGQFQFVNGRPAELKNFSYLVRKAYGEILPPGTHPYYFLFLECEPEMTDVNVHPAKKEVRLKNTNLLNALLLRSVSDALRPGEPLSFALRAKKSVSPAKEEHTDKLPGINAGQEHILGTKAFEIRSSFGNPLEEKNETGGLTEPTEFAKKSGSHERFLPKRHFGVIFGTYILAEDEGGFYIIDQHTAHERINYERIKNQFEELGGQRQTLIAPIFCRCLPDERESVLAKTDELLEAGFAVEAFAEDGYIIREVPVYIDPGCEEDAVIHVVQRLLEGEKGVRLYEEHAAMKACRASIKKNDHVSPEVIGEILKQLSECENPSRCPHGRPTMMRLGRDELDRMFHRI